MNADNSNAFEGSSSKNNKNVTSSQDIQESRSSNGIRINDLKTENTNQSSNMSSVPSYQKMKNKLETMRKQNLSNAANNILSPNKPLENSHRQMPVKVKNITPKIEEEKTPEEEKLNITVSLLNNRAVK